MKQEVHKYCIAKKVTNKAKKVTNKAKKVTNKAKKVTNKAKKVTNKAKKRLIKLKRADKIKYGFYLFCLWTNINLGKKKWQWNNVDY